MLCQWNAQASCAATAYEKIDPSPNICNSDQSPTTIKTIDAPTPAAIMRRRSDLCAARVSMSLSMACSWARDGHGACEPCQYRPIGVAKIRRNADREKGHHVNDR